MSLARLVITAVIVEGRYQERGGPRLRRAPGYWVQQLVQPFPGRGRGVRSSHGPAGRTPTRARSAWTWRTRSSGSARRLTKTGPGRRRGNHRRALAGPPESTPVPAVSTIWRILARRGFVTPQPQKRPRSSWKRFCADQPNERWQADITHWRLGDGSEVEILNILDDHSRLCIAANARRGFTLASQVWQGPSPPRSTRWGIPGRACSTDNGAVFTGKQRGRGPGRPGGPAGATRRPGQPFPALPSPNLRQGGAVPPNPEEVAGRATRRRHRGRAATPTRPVHAATTTPSGRTAP